MGRKTAYRNEYSEQAYKLCLLGLTDRQLADYFEVTEKTLNNWKRKHPEFLQSLRDGKDKADGLVVQSLYQKAIGFPQRTVEIDDEGNEVEKVHQHLPDTTACIFWLKNRQKHNWRDKQEVDATINGNLSIELVSFADRKNSE